MNYNLVKFGDIYLTDNGEVGGTPCRVVVDGIGDLMILYSGAIQEAADGMPYLYALASDLRGRILQLEMGTLLDTEVLGLATTINNAIGDALAPIEVTIDGPPGTWYLNCLPKLPKSLTVPGEYNNGRILGVTLTLSVQGQFEGP